MPSWACAFTLYVRTLRCMNRSAAHFSYHREESLICFFSYSLFCRAEVRNDRVDARSNSQSTRWQSVYVLLLLVLLTCIYVHVYEHYSRSFFSPRGASLQEHLLLLRDLHARSRNAKIDSIIGQSWRRRRSSFAPSLVVQGVVKWVFVFPINVS